MVRPSMAMFALLAVSLLGGAQATATASSIYSVKLSPASGAPSKGAGTCTVSFVGSTVFYTLRWV